MSFQEKLKSLLQAQQDNAKQRETDEVERKKLLERKQKDVVDEYARLKQIAQEKIQPILNVVNDTHLGGRGEVGVGGSRVIHKEGRNYEPVFNSSDIQLPKPQYVVAAYISLRWDEDHSSDGYFKSSGSGNRLGVFVDSVEFAVIAGEDKNIVTRISINDSKWQSKIEDAILTSLSSGKCGWSYYSDSSPS